MRQKIAGKVSYWFRKPDFDSYLIHCDSLGEKNELVHQKGARTANLQKYITLNDGRKFPNQSNVFYFNLIGIGLIYCD